MIYVKDEYGHWWAKERIYDSEMRVVDEMDVKICTNCRYYDGSNGLCRRNPPQVYSMGDVHWGFSEHYDWPYVNGTDWCGDWKLNPKKGIER
jgi:hypothetical protein